MDVTSGTDVSSLSLIVTSVAPFVLVFFVMYFLILRPQKVKQSGRDKMLLSLKKGDKVITQGGIVGVIAGFKDDQDLVILKIGESSKIDLLRSHIVSLFS